MNEIIKNDVKTIIGFNINWGKLKNKTVLVTGATGMMGQYLIFTLLELNNMYNYNIKILALCRNKERAEKILGINEYLKFIIQDVTKEINISDKIDYIIHTASPANPTYYSTNPVGTIMANTLGTRNTLELAKKNNASFCYISTMEVYGNMENNDGIKEEEYGTINFLEGRSCYPESKRLGENMCVAYNSQYGVDCKIIRPAHSYGPGMSINDTRVQSLFMKSVLNDENIIMKSDGTMKRTYTYILDVTSGIFFAILNGTDMVYNVANEEAVVSIKELANKTIETKSNTSSKLIMEIREEKGWSQVKPKIMNCDKLKSIGWTPIINPDEGLKRTMEYHLQENDYK